MKRLAICLASVIVLGLFASDARAQTTALFFDSQAGDYIGAGQVATYTPVDATFTATNSGGTTVSVNGPSFSFWWTLQFKAAGATPPAVGTYEMARRAPFTTFNGLDVSGSGRGCNELTGRFVVLEAQYDGGGNVVKFAADFEQHCEDADAALFGAIRYNS